MIEARRVALLKSALLKSALLKSVVFCVCLIPLGLLIGQAFTGELGANPVEAITHQTGEWGLRFLLIALLVTPLRKLSGWNTLVRLRRMLGLFGFFYVCLHLTTYVWLDAYFDIAYIVEDVTERLYITAGFCAFLALLPLAVTSTDNMIRRLGGRLWRRLHRLAYVAAAGGVLHFIWLVKADYSEPLIYAAVFSALMLLRLPPVSQLLPRIARRTRGMFESTQKPAEPSPPAGSRSARRGTPPPPAAA